MRGHQERQDRRKSTHRYLGLSPLVSRMVQGKVQGELKGDGGGMAALLSLDDTKFSCPAAWAAFLQLTAGPLRALEGTDHLGMGDRHLRQQGDNVVRPTASRLMVLAAVWESQGVAGRFGPSCAGAHRHPLLGLSLVETTPSLRSRQLPPHLARPSHQPSALRQLSSPAADHTQATAPATKRREHGLRQYQKAGVEPDPVRHQGWRAEDAEW